MIETKLQVFMCRHNQVAYEDFKYKKMHELAMATLDEIPREVCNYFRKYALYSFTNSILVLNFSFEKGIFHFVGT